MTTQATTTELNDLNQSIEALAKRFEAASNKYETLIFLDKRLYDEAVKDNVRMQLDFEKLKAAAIHIEKEAEALKEQYHSFAFTTEMKSNSKPGPMEARKYADCNKDYVSAVKVYNNALKLKLEIEAVVDVVISRKFFLNNMADVIVAGVEKHIL